MVDVARVSRASSKYKHRNEAAECVLGRVLERSGFGLVLEDEWLHEFAWQGVTEEIALDPIATVCFENLKLALGFDAFGKHVQVEPMGHDWRELFAWIPRIYRTDSKYDISLNLTLSLLS